MFTRRSILLTSGAAALGACANTPSATLAPSGDSMQIAEAARQLYARALVVDGNIAPPDLTQAEAYDIIRRSGLTACKASIGGFNAPYADTIEEIDYYDAAIREHPELLMQIRSATDFQAAKSANKLGILYSFEGVGALEDQLDRIDEFAGRGVKVMQLSYNLQSPFGAGVLADPPIGLTQLGRRAVERMNQVGVAIDLSHANPATTADAMSHSVKPVLMTHGGCAAVHPHPRNKTDEQLRALAEKGGVFGIYDLPYLTESPRRANLDDYIAHMAHALDVAGEGHVGIGSDTSFDPFDTSPEGMAAFEESVAQRRAAGVSAPGEDRPPFVEGLNTERRCEVIADALLKRGYSAAVAEKVLGANFIRAFGEIW